MDKHSLPTIEQIAAYLDGNLSEREMQQFSQLAEHDDVLLQLLDASSIVDSTMADFTDADLQLPPEISGTDFEVPKIENIDNFISGGDSFTENKHLYQQEAIHGEEQLLADVFDEMDSETKNVNDLDVDIGDEVVDDIEDILDI